MIKIFYLIRMSFLEGLILKNRIPLLVIEQLLAISVNYFIWKSVADLGYNQNYSYLQLVSYPIYVWIFNLVVTSNIIQKMSHNYKTGRMAVELIRPIDYFTTLFSASIGRALFKLLLAVVPSLLIVSLVVDIYIPNYLVTYLLTFLSCVLSVLIYALFDYIIGNIIVLTESGMGLFMLRCLLIDVFSGLLFPIDYAPLLLKKIIALLPFRHIYFSPISIFIEKTPFHEALSVLLNQFLWVIALTALSVMVVQKTKQFLQVQGG